MSRWMVVLALGCGFVGMLGCAKPPPMEPFRPEAKDYSRALPPGQLALRKIPPEMYPDFRTGFASRAGLEEATRHSIECLKRPSTQRYFPYGEITHDQALASLERFLEVLRSAKSADEFDAMIRGEYDVYQSVGCDDAGTVLFTGYYTPIFEGRLQRDARFRYPLYGLPPDLIKDTEGNVLGRQLPEGGSAPKYPTRREIESQRLLDGLEVAYVADPFESYVITVQGSARLRLADGSIYELGYAGNNGHEYSPVAQAMIRDGVMKREELSLQSMIGYFKAHPEQVYKYVWQNPRYVFFKNAPGGPFGSIGVPVTPYRSLATDKSIFPRACLSFVSTTLPRLYNGQVESLPYGAFALDQDTGGAIRAAGRCDVFMGIGSDAEAVAGRTYAEGKLYYIFLKSPNNSERMAKGE